MAKPWEKYSNTGGAAVIPLDPNAGNKEARAQDDQAMARERLRLAQEAAARSARSDELANTEKAEKLATERAEKDALASAQAAGMNDALYQIQNTISAAKRARDMAKTGSGIGSYEGGQGF